eukprot:CAMPEP_0182446270 /NCGR_PEP_ID=MMETSP1172-20130603/4096_1 /TAXON_ID=708627 /ORGANISM="Timspurckia oligopyrenoides, Strain CCMP3278" /LENGTH=419 /DNA_ID=CAMNT_0024642179 /DNA_START=105 /DNA_END=1364 /DNA_ORIENTATION=+
MTGSSSLSMSAFVGSPSTFLNGSTTRSPTNSHCCTARSVQSSHKRSLICMKNESTTAPTSSDTAAVSTKKDIVNIGIIGAGRIGQVHADTITFKLKNANLVGVASGTKQLADRCSLDHGCTPYYDYMELLENPLVDAVCICSASNQHTKQIIEAAEAGKHIFCEKPIDTNLSVIDEALKAVKKAGVKLQVGFNRRFDTNYRRVKKAIDDKEIGNPHIVHITSRDPSPPPIEYVKSSGGIWLDCSIHDFDMARFLIGDEVEEVYALGAVNITPGIEEYGDIDTSIVSLRFKNGVIGTIDNSRQAVYGYDQRCEVFGSAGSVAINNNYANSAVVSNGAHIQRDLPLHFFMDRYTDSFVVEMKDFCDVILHDKPIPCTGIDGRAPVVIALAAKKSYHEKRPVKLSEVDIPLPDELVGWDGQA